MKKFIRWPVGIAAIYSLFAVMLITFTIYSGYQQLDLVSDDYYNQGLNYQQQIDRRDRAQSLPQPVRWIHNNHKRALTIQFPSDFNQDLIHGQILFFRPSDAKQDKTVAIKLSSEGSQYISTKKLSPGLWKLKILWYFKNNEYYEEGDLVLE